MAIHHLQFEVQQKIIESAYRSLLSSQIVWHAMQGCIGIPFDSIRGKNHYAEPLKLEVYAELRIIKYG
ncbi:unnamed protein product [Sphagnum troendelagicum]|uniref:Uncharacterized protein n=1 Tax=Sphagnum troendelagicum TaxID=128251 RepID=A0ABP0UG24_9BRYO